MTSSLLQAPAPAGQRIPVPAPRLRRVRYEPEPTAGSGAPTTWTAPVVGPSRIGSGPAIPGPTAPTSPWSARPSPAARRRRPAPPAASRAEHVEAQHAAARQLRIALEVLDGRRPMAHLADQVAPAVLRYWQVAARQRRVRGPARFTRMRLCLPGTGVAEVAVTCEIDGRARALAARFERTRGRWRCTALRLG